MVEAISQVVVGYFQTIQKLQVPLFTDPSKKMSQVIEIFIRQTLKRTDRGQDFSTDSHIFPQDVILVAPP